MNQREERLRFLAEGAQNRVSSKVGRHLVVSIPRVRIRPAPANSPHFSPFPGEIGMALAKAESTPDYSGAVGKSVSNGSNARSDCDRGRRTHQPTARPAFN
jgi:hypothetical protein